MPRWTWIIAVVGVLYLQYRLWLGPGGYLEANYLQSRVVQAQQLNQGMLERNDALEAEITRLETDPAAIEYHARADLGMIKPGESFYLIVH